MSPDTTLDAFLGDASEDVQAEPTAPAVTYEWTPEGQPCENCGDSTTRRWESTLGMVCPSCKEW